MSLSSTELHHIPSGNVAIKLDLLTHGITFPMEISLPR